MSVTENVLTWDTETFVQLCARVDRLKSERLESEARMHAADVIYMFGFYALDVPWNQIRIRVSDLRADLQEEIITQDEYNRKLNTIARHLPPNVNIELLYKITQPRNEQFETYLYSISDQKEFLKAMNGRVWPESLAVVEPCLAYLQNQTLKRLEIGKKNKIKQHV